MIGQEVKKSCAEMYDDPEEDNGTQERRIRKSGQDGNRPKQEEGREEVVAVDVVLRARGIMQTDKANGLEDIIVTEMLKGSDDLHNYKRVPKCGFRGECDSRAS